MAENETWYGRETALCKGQERVVRRNQYHRCDWPAHSDLYCHARPKTAPDHGDLSSDSMAVLDQPVEKHLSIFYHLRLTRNAVRVPIASVVNCKNCHIREHAPCIARHPGDFLRAAAEIHYGWMGAGDARRQQPS